MKPIIYVTLQQFCETDATPRRQLDQAGFDVRYNSLGRRFTKEDLLRELRGVHAVMAGVEPYDASILEALPDLRCISRCGIGTDAIDLDVAQRRGIQIFTTPDAVTEPVAQLTVAMILALARNFPHHYSEGHQGLWKKRTGVLLSEWTVGLIGYGRIGQAVARYLSAFGTSLRIHDPLITSIPGSSLKTCTLQELLADSDVVSLHAGRAPQHGPVLGAPEFALMKPGSYVVNTARGHLIDETALAAALNSQQLAGAALDVFDQEPYTGPLATMPNVLCTPHVASLTRASRAQMERQCAEQVITFFQKHGLT